MNAVRVGAISGLVSVAAGAFGAHALKTQLDERMLAAFETGARYQLVHAVLLVVVGLMQDHRTTRALTWSARLLLIGTVLFSGSLYAMALSGVRGLGAITPLGGAAFMMGWLMLALGARRS